MLTTEYNLVLYTAVISGLLAMHQRLLLLNQQVQNQMKNLRPYHDYKCLLNKKYTSWHINVHQIERLALQTKLKPFKSSVLSSNLTDLISSFGDSSLGFDTAASGTGSDTVA